MEVRYYLHLLRKDDGTGGVPPARVQSLLARMAADFAPWSITFTEIGRGTINNSAWEQVDPSNFDSLIAQNPHDDAVDIYLGSIGIGGGASVGSGGGTTASGQALIAGGAFMVGYCAPEDFPKGSDPCASEGASSAEDAMVVITHEMDHALGLYHTHRGPDATGSDPCRCVELAGGEWNCGDLVLDTPGDPALPSDWDESTCTYTGGEVDAQGTPYTPDGHNIMNNAPYGCRTSFTAGQASRMFSVTLLQNARIVEAATLPSDFVVLGDYTTELFDAALSFDVGKRLVVEGAIEADGTTFTAENPQQGWSGLWFEPGSDGLIENAVVERVKNYGGASVYITNASPTFKGTTITDDAGFGTNGFYVSGSTASPILDNNVITLLSGDGIVLTGGADARLIQNQVLGNIGDGLIASGSGTEAFLSPPYGSDPDNGEFGNTIEDNVDGGVYASFSAYLTFGWYYYGGPGYHADGFNSVTNNGGVGLSAFYNGRIAAGNTTNQQRNRFFDNATHDAEAVGTGSRVWASCDWWNDTSPPFRTAESGGGIVDDAHYLLADPYVDPDAACVGFSGGLGRGQASTATKARSGDVARGEDTTPRGLLIAAAEVIDRNPVAALALLGQVIEQAPDDPFAATALAEAGYVLARADLPEPVRTSAEALLDAAVTGPRPALRAAALRALVAARQVRGDMGGALDAATALVEGATSSEDVFFGHLARVYLYAEAGQEAEAWAALAEVEAREPESVEAALARRHLEGPGEDGEGGRSAPRTAAPRASAEAQGADADGGFRLDPAYPNPTRRVGTITFALAEAGEVRVAVYDVLGREVAALADEVMEAGSHEVSLDPSVFPSGVYLVRLAAGERVATQRITVLR